MYSQIMHQVQHILLTVKVRMRNMRWNFSAFWQDLRICSTDRIIIRKKWDCAGRKLHPPMDEFNKYIDSLERGTIMQVGVKYIDPQFMDTGKDIEAMYTGAMTPEEVMENISRRRAEQAELQKDPAWE